MTGSCGPERTLQLACAEAGLDTAGATLLRAGENTLYTLRGGVVARITRPGQISVARKEVAVSRWLSSIDFPVVQALPGVRQPIEVGSRAVTFWRELPVHRQGTATEVGQMLKRLHQIVAPVSLELPKLDPLVRLAERIEENPLLRSDESDWLRARLDRLRAKWTVLPEGLPWCAVHGDAWGSNFVATADGVVMLDLERFATGPPEWDLACIGVDYETFGSMSTSQWRAVCDGYGLDVMQWPGYEVLRDIRELRKVTFAFQTAHVMPQTTAQARHRLACIRGQAGPRPWHWVGVV